MVYSNLLREVMKPTFLDTMGDSYTNFILTDGDLGTFFYPVTATTTMAAGTAYLQLPTSSVPVDVKAISFALVDGTVGIEETQSEEIESERSAGVAYYDLNGSLQTSLRKGLNLIRMSDGSVRKVMKR